MTAFRKIFGSYAEAASPGATGPAGASVTSDVSGASGVTKALGVSGVTASSGTSEIAKVSGVTASSGMPEITKASGVEGKSAASGASGVAGKTVLAKRGIVARIAAHGESTIAELAAELGISVPTASKFIEELVDEGVAVDHGKVETAGGRRPNIYGLAGDAAFFAGIAIGRDRIDFALTDLTNRIAAQHTIDDFTLEDDPRSLELILAGAERFIAGCGVPRERIFAAGVSLPGRVNTAAGESCSYFADPVHPLRDVVGERLRMEVWLENATRVKCYAEYLSRMGDGVRNMLYVDMGRELTVGIVADGRIYYGDSGFAGEFGHTPFFDNNVICSCGRRGCLETEVSGYAVENRMRALIESGVNTILRDKYADAGGAVHIGDIVDAATCGDTLSLELIEEAASKAGRSIALLLNILNPNTVVVGGSLARAGDYLMLPLRAAVNKHSPNAVCGGTAFGVAGSPGGAVDAAIMTRNKTTGLL